MLSLYILAAIIVPGILFLVYCFVSFSRAERRERKQQAAQSTGGQKQNHGREGMYKAVLATLALTVPAALAAQTTPALKETTATADHKPTHGFPVCGKWRRDLFNVPPLPEDQERSAEARPRYEHTAHGVAVWL
jgi:hypothetical protein